MDVENTTPPFQLTDPRQIRIHERLGRLVGAGPAAFFFDACRLMEQTPSYQSTTHLVAHLLREIESALRDVLEPVSAQSQQAGSSGKSGHKDEIRRVLSALGISEDAPIAEKWLELAERSSEGALHRRAHRDSLARPRPVDEAFRQFWNDMQGVLEAVSARLELRFSEYRVLMDDLAAKDTPTAHDIDVFCKSVPNSVIAWSYFFHKIRSPAWVEPLKKNAVFKQIPDLIRHENGISSPVWPAAKYLKKMAALIPDEVGKVLLEAPQTDNQRAVGDLAELACALPVTIAVEWTNGVIEWIKRQNFLSFGLPRTLGGLISNLAQRGQASAAIALAAALLDPAAHFDAWEYEQILSKNVPDLVAASTEGTLNLLCDLLDRTIALSDERSRPYDLSFIWRPAIEDHAQNLNLGLKEILVVCVRDTAEHIGRNSLNPALTLVEFFEKRGASWQIFSRIALHLLRVLPTTTAGMVAERLLNRELFDSDHLKHEYYLLEGQCFGQLTDSQKEVILGWINAGPAYTDEQLKRWEENFGRAWTLEEKAENARLWKYDRLRPVEQSLSGSWKELYEQLSSMVRGPRHPEFTTYHEGGAYGPRAPKNQDDLLKLSVESLIAYLQDWAPSDTGFPSPSREGLGRALTSIVANSPHPYAAEASRFKELSEPTYIRAVVQGFHDALKQKVAFNWLPVLDLCIWIVRHERVAPERLDDQFREDPHWGWAQAAVVRLLVDGFATTENPISFAQRESVWIAIQAVTRDPQPTRQEEDEYWQPTANDQPPDEHVQKIDPLTNAINTPRGVAMDALVRYALWVRSNLEKLQDKQAVIAQGLSVMPEVRDELDFHLNSENDPCVTIRAVYGLHLPWLQLLDPKWVEENTGRILPHNELPLWHAVWDTYVCSCQPFDNVFAWLHDEYAFAIEQIGTHNHNWANSKAADHSLAHHLMLLYSRGLLDAHRDLIAPFYRRADQKLRRKALHFVGWTLRSGKEPLSEAVLQRLKLLLGTRISASKEPGSLRAEELEEYGWWFVSGKFDDAWSIPKLLEILQLVGWVVPDHLVVERLAQISQAESLQCIECLTMLVNGDNRGWGVIGWRDEAMTIIRAARKSGDLESRKKAEELVNLLESRGNFEFGQLLNEPVP